MWYNSPVPPVICGTGELPPTKIYGVKKPRIANVIKFTRAVCVHMFRHFEQATIETGEYTEFSNIEIDPERTPLNYNLAPPRLNGQGAFLRRRYSEVQCIK
jgi:hypothetical protein